MYYLLYTVIITFILLITILLWGFIYDKKKITVYESGFYSYSNELYHYFIKYYFIALLFLIFDIEIILLYNFTPYLLIKPNIFIIIYIFYIIYFTLLYELIYITFEL